MNHHLVILKKSYIHAILKGRKTVESRFYRARHRWMAQIAAGDKLFLKAISGPVTATAMVAAVSHFDNLNAGKISELKKQYNEQILGDEQYWQGKMNARFGVLVRLKDARQVAPRFINKADWRAWVVLTKTENFGLIDSA